MKHLSAGLWIVIALVASVSSADGLVLCVNKSGAVLALVECKPGTTQLNPAAVELVGPAGPQGATGPAGPAGGGAHAYQTVNTAVVSVMPTTPGTTIVAMTLPAGSYQLIAQGQFSLRPNMTPGGLVRFASAVCVFQPQTVDGILVTSPVASDVAGVLPILVSENRTVLHTELVTLSAPTQVSFNCSLLGEGNVDVVGAQLFAVQVADITPLVNGG